MRTVDDVRAALLEIADNAPDLTPGADWTRTAPAGLAPTASDSPRRWRTGVAVAASVAAISGAAVLLPNVGHRGAPRTESAVATVARPTPVSRSGRTTTPSAVVADPLNRAISKPSKGVNVHIGFRVVPVSGFHTPAVDQVTDRWQAADVEQVTDWQQGNATGTIDGPDGTVYVFYRGAFNPAAARTGEPITVQGKPGYFARIPYLDPGASGSADSVVWQYARNAWAVVQLEYPGGAQNVHPAELAIADAVRNADTTLIVPFRLGYLPAGLSVAAIQSTVPGNGDGVDDHGTVSHIYDTGATFMLDGGLRAAASGGDALDHGLEVHYLIDPAGRADTACGVGMTRRTVHHVRMCLHVAPRGIDGITIWRAHGSMNIAFASNYVGRYTASQVESLASTVIYAANPLVPETWFTASAN